MCANEVSEPATPIANGFSTDSVTSPTKASSHQSSASTSPGASLDSDAILHPENYLWVEYNVGSGCVGDEGTCPCGDTCACIACAIHKPWTVMGTNVIGDNAGRDCCSAESSTPVGCFSSVEEDGKLEDSFDDFVHIDRLVLERELEEEQLGTPRLAKKSCCGS